MECLIIQKEGSMMSQRCIMLIVRRLDPQTLEELVQALKRTAQGYDVVMTERVDAGRRRSAAPVNEEETR